MKTIEELEAELETVKRERDEALASVRKLLIDQRDACAAEAFMACSDQAYGESDRMAEAVGNTPLVIDKVSR